MSKRYWLCNDAQGTYLYCGEKAPVLEDDIFVPNEGEYDWVDVSTLDKLDIKYPKNLPLGECKQIKLRIKAKW